jgi:hypothetical protein
MKHFNCDFRVQHLNLHWHISFLLVAKSEILYTSVIYYFYDLQPVVLLWRNILLICLSNTTEIFPYLFKSYRLHVSARQGAIIRPVYNHLTKYVMACLHIMWSHIAYPIMFTHVIILDYVIVTGLMMALASRNM